MLHPGKRRAEQIVGSPREETHRAGASEGVWRGVWVMSIKTTKGLKKRKIARRSRTQKHTATIPTPSLPTLLSTPVLRASTSLFRCLGGTRMRYKLCESNLSISINFFTLLLPSSPSFPVFKRSVLFLPLHYVRFKQGCAPLTILLVTWGMMIDCQSRVRWFQRLTFSSLPASSPRKAVIDLFHQRDKRRERESVAGNREAAV